MTDDTDDRMDRAKRIRRMREGQRAAAEESADETSDADDSPDEAGDSSSAETPDDAGTTDSPDAEATGEAADDSGEADSLADAADDDQSTSDDVTDGATGMDTSASTDSADARDEPTDRDDASDLEQEAMAAAQRAAQSAAQVSGEGVAQVVAEADGQGATEGDGQVAAAGGAGPTMPQGPTGVELPDEATIQSAIADEVLESGESVGTGTARAGVADRTATREESVRVLEFTVGSEHYCLDIEHVEEIVKRDSITRVPNTPDYVEGVVDLRGQITTILDPKVLLGIDEDGPESLLVVFDPEGFEDQGAIGWVVDAVRQVVPVAESEISDPPVDDEHIEGVVDREDEEEFVIWTDPEVAIRQATAEGDTDD